MSEEIKDVVPVIITEDVKKKALQSAIYYLTKDEAFYGSMLQELTMKYLEEIPTAGITFNEKSEQFEIYLNPKFFTDLTTPQRVAVLHHEILHFTNKHLFRLPFMTAKSEERMLQNIAGDMSINQYIKNLPEGCVDVKDWKFELNGIPTPFPVHQSMEHYYELIKNNKELNKDKLEGYKPFDVHDWSKLDEESQKKMLAEAKKIVKRTVEKTKYSYTNVPDSIKDLLEEIETMAAALDYKSILKRAIKKSVSVSEREHTWKRPNKRYGAVSPGTKLGSLPKLSMYADTSGSISLNELNQFLSIISKFLKVGSRECLLGLWHTELYYKKKYKLNNQLASDAVQSGGTSVQCVLDDVKKTKPDLTIILTDGYYDNAQIDRPSEIIWIISKGGNKNHPLQHIGKTILLDSLKD